MEEFKIADIKKILKEDSFGQNRNDFEKAEIISKVKEFFKTKKEKKQFLVWIFINIVSIKMKNKT